MPGWFVRSDNFTDQQMKIFNQLRDIINQPVQNSARVLVKGPAGTGKTLILSNLALEIKGKKGIFFIYTNILLKFITDSLGQFDQSFTANTIDVKTFDSWLYHTHRHSFGNPPSNIAYDIKRGLMIQNLMSTVDNMFDFILVDEGQDFDDNVIDLMLKISPKIIFVGDSNQAIYKKKNRVNDTLDNKLKPTVETEDLDVSFRISPSTTKMLASYALSSYENLKYVKREPVEDSVPLWIRNSDVTEDIKYLSTQLLPDYIRSGRNVVIVTLKNNVLQELYANISKMVKGVECILISKNRKEPIDFRKNAVYFTTMHSVKGLEFDNLVYFHDDSSDFTEDIKQNLAYTVFTRPRYNLVIFSESNAIPLEEKLNKKYMTILDELPSLISGPLSPTLPGGLL